MKAILFCLVLALAVPFFSLAGGSANSYRLDSGVVALTNTQANSSWVPVAILWKFDGVTNAVASVERVSQGDTYLLGVLNIPGGMCVVWVPEVSYPFAQGDVLRIVSSVTNGVVQVIRRGE